LTTVPAKKRDFEEIQGPTCGKKIEEENETRSTRRADNGGRSITVALTTKVRTTENRGIGGKGAEREWNLDVKDVSS